MFCVDLAGYHLENGSKGVVAALQVQVYVALNSIWAEKMKRRCCQDFLVDRTWGRSIGEVQCDVQFLTRGLGQRWCHLLRWRRLREGYIQWGKKNETFYLGDLRLKMLGTLLTIKNSQCERCELSFIWGKIKTTAWEIAFQIALRNFSEEVGEKSVL